MAGFYFDNDIADELGSLLQQRAHDVLHTRNLGQSRATDDQQVLTAERLGFILITHNAKDFVLLHRAWRSWPQAFGVAWPRHAGILVIPQKNDLAVDKAAAEVDNLVRSGVTIGDAVYRWRLTTGWRHEP